MLLVFLSLRKLQKVLRVLCQELGTKANIYIFDYFTATEIENIKIPISELPDLNQVT